MRPDQILPSSFLDNLGTDWIAVNHQGTVIGRASTEAAVRRANPGAEAFFSAADLTPEKELLMLDPDALRRSSSAEQIEAYEEGVWTPIGETMAPDVPKEPFALDPDGNPPSDVAPVDAPVDAPVEEGSAPVVDGSAFDHDGDGKVGGSAPKSRKRKPAGR